jgi:putative alpha-1,2-mannosidase
LNLTRELGKDTFDQTVENAGNTWNRELSRIEIEGGTLDQQKTFYTALYRTLLFPRKFYELNENNEIVHYSPYNGEVLPGYMFTDNGFWDTFRAVFPFFTVMYQDLNSQIMQGLVNNLQRERLAARMGESRTQGLYDWFKFRISHCGFLSERNSAVLKSMCYMKRY